MVLRRSKREGRKQPELKAARRSASLGGLPLPVATAPGGGWERLRKRLRSRVEKGQWPGIAACAIIGGQLQMIEERGYADVEAKIPMNRKSIVRIYSMSKCVVAAAVLQLAEEGHLTLDDELSKHIPAFENPKVLAERSDGMPDFCRLVPSRRPITIRHLLTHTSGISCGLAPVLDGPRIRSARERAWANIYTPLVDRVDRNEFKCLADWVQELANVPLVSHPGQHYGYGYSYDVLGHLIELKSGKQLETYLRDHILGPLGMSDTGFSLTTSKARRLSVLYRYTEASPAWKGAC